MLVIRNLTAASGNFGALIKQQLAVTISKWLFLATKVFAVFSIKCLFCFQWPTPKYIFFIQLLEARRQLESWTICLKNAATITVAAGAILSKPVKLAALIDFALYHKVGQLHGHTCQKTFQKPCDPKLVALFLRSKGLVRL